MLPKSMKILGNDGSDKLTSSVVPPPVPRSARGSDQRKPSVFASNLSIFGDIKSEGDIHIEGEIDGSISCRTLTVANTSRIHGNITCKNLELSQDGVIKGDVRSDDVKISGKIEGHITSRSVHLYSTAKVLGNIVHESLSIEAGAHLDGECRHSEEVVRLLESAHSESARSNGKSKANAAGASREKSAV